MASIQVLTEGRRQSCRLLEAGYYTASGRTISYRERTVPVFGRRRKSHKGRQNVCSRVAADDHLVEDVTPQWGQLDTSVYSTLENAGRNTMINFTKLILMLLVFFSLIQGVGEKCTLLKSRDVPEELLESATRDANWFHLW